jgi:hypothetical protein
VLHLHTFRFAACLHPLTLISYLNAHIESSWNVVAHVDAGRGSEGETGEWSG